MLLPDPVAPMTATNCPDGTASDTSRNAQTGARRAP
ncbi:hypothetical protein ABH935_001043 [Catenulispora sp. GAS73]